MSFHAPSRGGLESAGMQREGRPRGNGGAEANCMYGHLGMLQCGHNHGGPNSFPGRSKLFNGDCQSGCGLGYPGRQQAMQNGMDGHFSSQCLVNGSSDPSAADTKKFKRAKTR